MKNKNLKHKPLICYWCSELLAPNSRSKTAICDSCNTLFGSQNSFEAVDSQNLLPLNEETSREIIS